VGLQGALVQVADLAAQSHLGYVQAGPGNDDDTERGLSRRSQRCSTLDWGTPMTAPKEFWDLLHEWSETQNDERTEWIEHRFNELFALATAPKVEAALRAPAEVPRLQDGDIKALYVKQHGTDEGWLGRDGSYFIAGVQAGRAALTQAPTPQAPDGVWEALQRLIENAETLGPASRDDALLVARYRDAALHTATPQAPAVAVQAPRSPIEGERFVRAWLGLEKLPGCMMQSNEGRFGPVGAFTSCAITTSEAFLEDWRREGKPFIEVWLADATPQPPAQPQAVTIEHLPGTTGDSLEDAMKWAAQPQAHADLREALQEMATWAEQVAERRDVPERIRSAAIGCAKRARAALSAPPPAQAAEAQRPDILEKLTYHAHERDDMTIDDLLEVLASGYRKVHGRTERQMQLQLLALLAASPSPAASAEGKKSCAPSVRSRDEG
jgi:hypothetical protein